MSRKSSLSTPSPSKLGCSNGIGSEEGWSDEATKELLNKMKQMIAKPDVSKYKTMLQKFEWDKLQVGRFSSEECKKQWNRVYKKLRKFKTLTDLVTDSLEYIENPYKGNVKKHPDHPKRPLTPYFRFFLCERSKYAESHKDLTNLQITSILSKKYREITEQEKERYMDEWKAEMIEYRAKLEQFKNNHPEYYDKSPPRMSRTPLQIFNQENMLAIPSSRSKKRMTKKQIQKTLKNKYHDLEDDLKLPYILKAIEEWDKYKEELEMYKKSHPEFVSASNTKSTLTINDWKIHDKSLGKPDRPPANGYNLFCTRMMVSDAMKHMSSRDRIMQCGQKWQLLVQAEKEAYQSEFLSMRETYRTDMKKFLKGLTPRQREEYLERKKETDTKKNSKRKIPIHIKEEDVVSDSDTSSDDQDEEIEMNDDSSSESSSSSSSEDEEEEVSVPKKKSQPPAAKITSSAPLRPTTPISALFLYQKAHRERFAAKHPKMAASDVAIMLARRYNNLPQEKKAKYIQKENEERALRNEQMRKRLLGEQEKLKDSSGELKAVTGEQIYQEHNKASYLKKANGLVEKCEEMMRRAWTQMSKERRKKYINIAHEQNAKNIAEHQAAKSSRKETEEKRDVREERNLSQKEIKTYLSLEPKKVPKDGLLLFKMEQKPRLNHLTPTARNQELLRLWTVLSQANKNKYKERAKTSLTEYNKKMQRWIKSLPPQAHEAYKATLEKKTKSKATKEKATAVSNGSAKKRKAVTGKTAKGAKKAKTNEEESDESSDDSSDGDSSTSSSDDSDDDSDSSSSDDSSSDDSDSSESESEKPAGKAPAKKQDSSDESSSSSDDDSDSD